MPDVVALEHPLTWPPWYSVFNLPVLFSPPLPSSSTCMASFLYADNSQIYTYSPCESPALGSAASWASPLGWFIVQPPTREACRCSWTPPSFSHRVSPFILTTTPLPTLPSNLTQITLTASFLVSLPPLHPSSCNQNDLTKI